MTQRPTRRQTGARRGAVLTIVSLALVTLLATPTLAKGPGGATITGPGLSAPVVLGGGHGGGEPGSGAPFGELVERTGFFPAVFGQGPDPMLDEPPSEELGPEYTIVWNLPGPGGADDVIVQSLYPYAAEGPLTHLQPGLPFWDGDRTAGGWFRGGTELSALLVELGLPAEAPPGSLDGAVTGVGADVSTSSVADLAGPVAAITGGLLLIAMAAVLVRWQRRRWVPEG